MGRFDKPLFHDDLDDEDDEYAEISKYALDVPQEENRAPPRLMEEGGAMHQTAAKIQEKALEAAFQAVDVTGQQLVLLMRTIAEDTGWLSNCNTVDDMVKGVVNKYPLLKGAKSVLGQLKKSFKQGRQNAEEERARPVTPVRRLEQSEVEETTTPRTEELAGFDDVPLNEADVDCEPEQLEGDEWEQLEEQ
ncbi:hypothetical protein LTR08_008421 [Meristemomyces frigidus]|nr:hypothetical protein LTR08_008421 [Meristemomyces frigidus]